MTRYIPVLRAKANDIDALNRLSPLARANLRPLIQPAMSLVGSEVVTDCLGAVECLAGRLSTSSYYFDPLGFESFDRSLLAFRTLLTAGEDFIPTIGLWRGQLGTRALADFLQESHLALAIRLEAEDLEDASEDTWAQLIRLTHDLRIPPSKITLILDFADLANTSVQRSIDSVVEFLALQPKNFIGSEVVLLGGTALRSVSPSIPLDGLGSVDRKELSVWANLQFELEGLHSLHFGDYGVMAPSFVFPSSGTSNANAKIRYTQGSKTHYFRGHSLYRPNRFDQYHELAQRVVGSRLYLGPQFSYGDNAILECANRAIGPGNLGTWVKFDTNHHLEFVARQIQLLAVDIASATNTKDLNALLESEIAI